MVMATGIVSIAGHLLRIPLVGAALFALDNVLYVALWGLTVLRVARFPDAVRSDLVHHGRAVGFFTIVAGTCVSQVLDVPGLAVVPAVSVWVALAAWTATMAGLVRQLLGARGRAVDPLTPAAGRP